MTSIGRRTLLTSAAAISAVRPLQAAPSAPLDPDVQADVILALRKLRYRADDGIVFWWIVGSKYIQVGSSLTLLYNMHVGTAMRVKNSDGGTFGVTSLETVFYTDPAGGAELKEWKNPYTGATVAVPIDMVGPITLFYRPDGTPIMPTEIGGAPLQAEAHIGPAVVAGDDVWVRDDSTARVTGKDPAAAPFVVNDWATYAGKVSDVRNAKLMSAPATVTLQEVTGFQRWMQMGDTAEAKTGNLFSRGVGRKVASYAEMPPIWRGLVAAHFPDIARELASNPNKALDRATAKFER